MRPEELAYKEGFRVTKEGELYNLNGKTYSTHLNVHKKMFNIVRRKRGIKCTVYVARFQAYLKYGEKLYDYKLVRHLNSDSLDCSFDNILIGKGSEIIGSNLEGCHKTKRAYLLGYRVDKSGNLFLNGVKVNNKIGFNRAGYMRFSIPFKKDNADSVFVHQLQAYQKFGDKLFEVDCVRHMDSDKKNNSYSNIELGSYQDNSDDVPYETRLGVSLKKIKFPVSQRNLLRKQFATGKYSFRDLAKRHKMSPTTVSNIIKFKTYV